jgi:hypothetical protein
MASNPNISLPQIPKEFDPILRDYLTSLAKILTSKQLDDYTTTENLKKRISDLE